MSTRVQTRPRSAGDRQPAAAPDSWEKIHRELVGLSNAISDFLADTAVERALFQALRDGRGPTPGHFYAYYKAGARIDRAICRLANVQAGKASDYSTAGEI